MSDVPCNGCTQCCKWRGELVIRPMLYPDEIGKYKHRMLPDGTVRLAASSTGSCVYLSKDGCSIWETRPKVCRSFDCRDLLERMARGKFGPMIRVMVAATKLPEKQ